QIKLVIIRLTLTGVTEFSRKIEEIKDKLCNDLEFNISDIQVIIDKIFNKTGLEIDLEKLTESSTPASIIAGYLKKIKSGNEDELPQPLIKELKRKLLEVYNSNAYKPLRVENRVTPPDTEEIIDILEKESKKLLNALIAQKEE
ncbi:MAG: hypothetical protein ACOCP5_04225, partial [Halanaerobiaceae bacterium]